MKLGWIDQKRQYRRHQKRVDALPAEHRAAISAITRYLYVFGPGRSAPILTMLDDLADLFEAAAADGTPVRAVVGEDPVEFVEAFVANYPTGAWIQRERDRLTQAIDAAEGRSR